VWDEAFVAQWNKMLQTTSFRHIYHRPEVVRAWVDTCGVALRVRPMVGLATHENGAHVLLLWMTTPYKGQFLHRQILEPIGQALFGYHDPLVVGDDVSRIDWQELWEVLRCSLRTACDQALFRFVHPRYAYCRHTMICAEESPVLQLDQTANFAGLLARCSQNHRGDVRRRFRRLAERGDVTLSVMQAGDTELAVTEFRDHFVPAYNRIWDGHPAGNLLRQPGVSAFLARVVGEGVRDGWGHFVSLRVNGQPIAWHLGLYDHGQLYWWVPTYDPGWERFSPGKVLLAKLIEHAIAAGWSQIHFLTGGHAYKLAWRPDALDLRTIRWYAPSLRGTLAAWYDRYQQRR
jgi:CelD/BcsL family acetyltransferase involved in cellulose biosynthesis